jgi:hypothetical protein
MGLNDILNKRFSNSFNRKSLEAQKFGLLDARPNGYILIYIHESSVYNLFILLINNTHCFDFAGI